MKTAAPIDRFIREALAEDLAAGDVTSNTLIAKDHRCQAVIFTKEEAVVCGLEIAKRVFKTLDPSLNIRLLTEDGRKIKKNQKVIQISGRTRSILSAERIALNVLSHLSAISTKTRRYVDAVKPYPTQILDTRKTTPTLRFLERYAVRCGGGFNHRDNLNEMVLVKDNHLMVNKTPLIEAIERLRRNVDVSVEVEVDRLSQLKDVLQTGVEMILLDNMPPAKIRKAVEIRNRLKKPVLLEASGGITLKNVRQYAKCGVDRISIGNLTHSRQAIDFSLECL